MKETYLSELNNWINERKTEIDRLVLRQESGRIVRTRPRDTDESKILDILCKKKWNQAISSGKVKILNVREWYYEPD